jgi:transcriptional regulator of acetoin/glycerol metabolism
MGKKFPDYVPPTQIAYRPDGATTLHLRKCRLVLDATTGGGPSASSTSRGHLGAMDDNDLVSDDDTVSRYHCRIVQEENAYVLQDLGSTNGTFINKRAHQGGLPRARLHGDCSARANLGFQSFDERCRSAPPMSERFGDIIGTTCKMREIFGILEKIAPTDTTVVIEGETGTGKEVVARTVHKQLGPRRASRLWCSIVRRCPRTSSSPSCSGTRRGSFTGAIMARPGSSRWRTAARSSSTSWAS